MSQHPIVLRAAEPTFDEGLLYARFLDEAADGFFRILLGRRAEDIIAASFIQPDHSYSYQNVTFAERNGAIVGMASGYTSEQHRRFSDQPLKQAVGKRALRMRCVKLLLAPLWRLLDTLADGDYYLQAIAVDPDARGQGVGTILMDSAEDRARAGESARLALDVSAKNGGARRLYERRGMTVESKWPRPSFVPSVLVRMTKPL